MKQKILIIETNFCKFFATKLVIETQLKLKINVIESSNITNIVDYAREFSPRSIVYCPKGGVVDLFRKMKRRGINQRNTQITLVLADESDPSLHENLQKAFTKDVHKAA
jgi:hypothetical protein